MNLFQWCKYQLYHLTILAFPKEKLRLFASFSKTKWLRDIFFRPKGVPEIYKKKIRYYQFILHISCPLQMLIKAENRGIESSLSRLIINELSKGDQCIDIGANFGFITMIMAKSVGLDGHVFSFEAESYIFQVLTKNINDNALDKICTVGNYFISNKSNMNVKKIDDIIKKNRKEKIKLIKIDTDGSDYNCLLGAEQLIKKDMPIIVIEINEKGTEIYNKLVDLGYDYFYDQYYNVISTNNMPPNLIASCNQLENIYLKQ